ncbi:unnamed protein product [Miscanthus lutarioriparius]|uniref:ALOG domain-containing protein n=1 Tax=Miscanthus lutarioriparius TaxID=422564 RepID=A0A811NM36_9POAL|nr:unnamed protein product [Miscanthus lutarioriparius]
MSTSGGGARSWSPPRRPSRYDSQKRRDWHTFTRYLAAHRPPLELCRCSGAHVLEFLRYLDRFGKTRVHAPLCAAYGGCGGPAVAAAPCQCPLRQAWGSLDALVGRLRAAFEERHGARGSGIWTSSQSQQPAADGRGVGVGDAEAANPFAARAVRLYLRDIRDAQSRARGISYSRKKKKRGKQQDGAAAAAPGCARPHVNGATTLMPAAALPPAPPPPPPPPPYCLAGVPFEFCDYGTVLGGVTANGAPGFYLASLFNTFG